MRGEGYYLGVMRTETNTLGHDNYVLITKDGEGQPVRVAAAAYFDTVEERDAFISSFPKWVKVAATSTFVSGGPKIPTAMVNIGLIGNGVNKGVNESGIKRARRFLSAIVESGSEIHYPEVNNFMTVEEFMAEEGQA
jgi:hypothetical protein